MSSYDNWRQSEHLRRQAAERFGQGSKQEERAAEIVVFWFDKWIGCGSPIVAPPADILEERIKDAECVVRRYRKESRS